MSYHQGNPGQPDPWANPQPASPGYGQPGYGQPGSDPSGYGQPGYGPGYDQPGHPQPVSGQPTSGQPVTGQPGYGYQPSEYPQPGYGPQPPYDPTGYGQPGYGQPVPTTSDERSMATIVHVLAIFFGWIGALIIYVMKKDESRFVRHHAAEALNVTLTGMIVSFGIMIISCFLSLVVIGFFTFLLVIPYGITLVVFMVIAAMAANRGELYAYPPWLRFPMVK